METKELRITRVFDAPRARIWDMWTKPEEVMKWWGPKPFTAPVIKIDLRVGGKYLFCMHGAMGPGMPTQDFWSGGTYKEIVPMEKIVCTDGFANENGDLIKPSAYGMPADFPDENTVTITFADAGEGKTQLSIVYIAETQAVLDAMIQAQMEAGWKSSLEKLAENL